MDLFNLVVGGKMDIINADLAGNISIINTVVEGNISIINTVVGGNISIINAVVGGNIRIINAVVGGNIDIVNPVVGGNIDLINPVLAENTDIITAVNMDIMNHSNIRFSMMKMERSSTQHRSQNQLAEIVSKEGLPVNIHNANGCVGNPAWKDSNNRFSMMKMERYSIQHRSQNQRAEIVSKEGLPVNIHNANGCVGNPAWKDSNNRFSMMEMERYSIQHRSQNQRAEIVSREGLPVNIDAANAYVVTPSRELQTDELTTVNLYTENASSVVFINNIPVRSPSNVFNNQGYGIQNYGTGFIWDDKGHIVTNYHVIKDASALRVKLHDQSEYGAKVIGCHQYTDVAVLVIDTPKKLRPVLVGSSRDLLVGQKVYAIGNPVCMLFLAVLIFGFIFF